MYQCWDGGDPIGSRYIFLENTEVRRYTTMILCAINRGVWKKYKNTMFVTFGNHTTKFTENDSMFLTDENERGRSLIKIRDGNWLNHPNKIQNYSLNGNSKINVEPLPKLVSK